MTSKTASGIAYDDTGSGATALVFMPGWCGPRTVFAPLTDRLHDRFRTLAIDWRGHGESAPASGDFGFAELVDDAVAVLDHAGVDRFVPVGVAHAGWAAIELHRRLGAERVPRLVLLDWMVLGAPPPFLEALSAMSDPASTRSVVDQISAMWLAHLDLPDLSRYVAAMTAFPDDMWARAARAIAAEFARDRSPLDALRALGSPPETLHLYAQPADPAFLDAQRAIAGEAPWFQAERLAAESHFPMFEVPDTIADRIGSFLA